MTHIFERYLCIYNVGTASYFVRIDQWILPLPQHKEYEITKEMLEKVFPRNEITEAFANSSPEGQNYHTKEVPTELHEEFKTYMETK